VQLLRRVPMDRVLRIVEGEEDCSVLDLPPLRFHRG
jgi:hypothetical protein